MKWTSSTHFPRYVGDGYLHDDRLAKGEKTLTFEPTRLPPGEYEVLLAYIPGGGRDRATPVTVFHAQGETEVRVDQEAEPPIAGRWVSLGRYRIETDGFSHVLALNAGTTSYVTADAVQFLPVGDGAAGAVPALPASPRPEASDDALKSLEEWPIHGVLGEGMGLLGVIPARPGDDRAGGRQLQCRMAEPGDGRGF